MVIIFKRDNVRVKKPEHLQKNIFIICSPRTVTVKPATCIKIDAGITLILPKLAKAFIISKFRRDEIFEIHQETEQLCIEILSKSYRKNFKFRCY